MNEHITDIRQLAEEMALTAEGVPGMNLTLSKARIAMVCRAFLALRIAADDALEALQGTAAGRPGRNG